MGPSGLWRHRNFRLLWAGQSVSELGSQVSVLAVPLVAIDDLHSGALGVGILTAMQTLPFLLIGLPAGAWVDRLPRRSVLIVADIGRALALGSIPAAWALSSLTLAQLYVVSVVSGMLTVFFDVAYQSYLPAVVGPERLVDGNAKLAATMAGSEIGGPALGGALVGAVGGATAVLADALSFVVSVSTVLAMRPSDTSDPAGTAVRDRGSRPTLRSDIAEGLRFVWHEPRIRSVAGATGTSNLFGAMDTAILLLFLRRQLHLSPGHIGVLLGLGSIGGLLGAVSAARLAARVGVGRTILGTVVVAGVGEAAYPLATSSSADVLVVLGGLLVGFGAVAYNVNQLSMRQTLCPPRLLGRMNASVRFMVYGTMPLGAALGGVLGTWIGLRPTLWVAAAGSMTAFVWVLTSPVPAIRTMPSPVPDVPADVAS